MHIMHINERVVTREGTGFVTAHDLITGLVTVELDRGDTIVLFENVVWGLPW